MERWKVFFNIGGVLTTVGVTFLVLGLANGVMAFSVVGATHFIAGCAIGLVGISRRGKHSVRHGCGL